MEFLMRTIATAWVNCALKRCDVATPKFSKDLCRKGWYSLRNCSIFQVRELILTNHITAVVDRTRKPVQDAAVRKVVPFGSSYAFTLRPKSSWVTLALSNVEILFG